MATDPRVDALLIRMAAAEVSINNLNSRITDVEVDLGDLERSMDVVEESIENLDNIHSKGGWHQQQITQALYKKPADLLIYYGWLNAFNSATNQWNNENVAQDIAKYGVVVFGDGIQDPAHGDYVNTQIIIARVKALNPSTKIFGYVTTNQGLASFQTKAAQWNNLQVRGIFMDESGYDYGTVATNGRAAFNTKIDYVHGLSCANLCFVNAWNMDHIIGISNDVSYPNTIWNSSLLASNLTYNDWYLLESFPLNTLAYSSNDGYELKDNWAMRGVKAINHRYTYNINVAACGIISDSNGYGQDLFEFGFISALMFSLEAFGTSSDYYGAGTAQVEFWNRPDISNLSKVWSLTPSVQADVNDFDVYVRFVEFGKLLLDFSISSHDSLISTW